MNAFFLDTIGILPDSAYLSNYLKDADAPGYFDSHGFIQGGVSPGTEYSEIEGKIKDLTPYIPKEVSELIVEFK